MKQLDYGMAVEKSEYWKKLAVVKRGVRAKSTRKKGKNIFAQLSKSEKYVHTYNSKWKGPDKNDLHTHFQWIIYIIWNWIALIYRKLPWKENEVWFWKEYNLGIGKYTIAEIPAKFLVFSWTYTTKPWAC